MLMLVLTRAQLELPHARQQSVPRKTRREPRGGSSPRGKREARINTGTTATTAAAAAAESTGTGLAPSPVPQQQQQQQHHHHHHHQKRQEAAPVTWKS
jgi:hypothetical protein